LSPGRPRLWAGGKGENAKDRSGRARTPRGTPEARRIASRGLPVALAADFEDAAEEPRGRWTGALADSRDLLAHGEGGVGAELTTWLLNGLPLP